MTQKRKPKPIPPAVRRVVVTRRERAARRLEKNLRRLPGLFPDRPNKSIADIQTELARRIAIVLGNQDECWRGCREPACRRARACLAPRIECSHQPPLEPASERQIARVKALVYRTLQQASERAQQERQGDAGP